MRQPDLRETLGQQPLIEQTLREPGCWPDGGKRTNWLLIKHHDDLSENLLMPTYPQVAPTTRPEAGSVSKVTLLSR